MANQRHSAFDVFGNPFVRGGSLSTPIDINNYPQWAGPNTITDLDVFDLSTVDIRPGDVIRLHHNFLFDQSDVGDTVVFSVTPGDGVTTSPSIPIGYTTISDLSTYVTIDTFIQVLEDSSGTYPFPFNMVVTITFSDAGVEELRQTGGIKVTLSGITSIAVRGYMNGGASTLFQETGFLEFTGGAV